MTDRKKPMAALSLILLAVELSGFYRVTQSPNYATYRSVDMVQLTGCGVCVGVAMVMIFMIRGVRS